jgi:hypothetical protein
MKKKSGSADILEQFDLTEAVATDKIDEKAGIIRDVVLMTGEKVSKNKTRYSRASVEQAVTRYEGAKMFLDHPRRDDLEQRKGARSVRDLGGVYRNLRMSEGAQPKLLGDLHLMEHNKDISISIAKNPPKDTGLSLRDRGLVKEERGVTLVESFEGDDFSIDFVVTASLNKSLFESAQTGEGGGEQEMDLTKLTLESLKTDRKDLAEALIKEGREAATAEMKKQLEEAGVKSASADKLVALAESAMSPAFKEAIRPAVMKTEVTLEEAKKVILAQEALFKSVPAVPAKGKDGVDPAVQTQGARTEEVQEGKKEFTNDAFLAAFK